MKEHGKLWAMLFIGSLALNLFLGGMFVARRAFKPPRRFEPRPFSLHHAKRIVGPDAAPVVERVMDNPELELTLGGRLTRAAVLFSDIVGFTPRSEERAPEDVVEELNIYFAHVDPAFKRHDGVIDKRMGDGVMAVFPPRPDDDGPHDVELR